MQHALQVWWGGTSGGERVDAFKLPNYKAHQVHRKFCEDLAEVLRNWTNRKRSFTELVEQEVKFYGTG